ncbi:MAG TPA: CPBP family glutamic-type intramembrane protease, partial [Pirellulales bacterium]|nr:CPBP family glutamic-type intramembrane protease [Pirellulales bacterium]
FAECATLALGLLIAGRLQGLVAQMLLGPRGGLTAARAALEIGEPGFSVLGAALGFAGAGVYEEVLFRLLLLPPMSACVARLGLAGGARIAIAVAGTSLLFAAAHYLGPHGEEFEAFSFWFRFTAGAVFAMLFVYRGFGIAAGTHALYDIFVSVG